MTKPSKPLSFNAATHRRYTDMLTRFGPRYNLAQELVKPGRDIPFSLPEFRTWVYDLMQSPRGLRCTYCDKPLKVDEMSPDHDVPVKRGGGLGLDNLVPSCRVCNVGKDELTGQEWRAFTEGLKTFPDAAQRNILKRLRAGAMGLRNRFFPRDTKKPLPVVNLAVNKSDPRATVPTKLNLFEEKF